MSRELVKTAFLTDREGHFCRTHLLKAKNVLTLFQDFEKNHDRQGCINCILYVQTTECEKRSSERRSLKHYQDCQKKTWVLYATNFDSNVGAFFLESTKTFWKFFCLKFYCESWRMNFLNILGKIALNVSGVIFSWKQVFSSEKQKLTETLVFLSVHFLEFEQKI